MRRVGLADALGGVAALTAIVWLPGSADPLTYIKLLVLTAGGLAVAPFVILRWRDLERPTWPVTITMGAAVLLVSWGALSAIGSGAPLWNSAFGWWGRGDGWLAWLGALSLLLGGASLSSREVGRTVTWLLAGSSFVAVVGVLQLAGISIPEGSSVNVVSGTMGNTNFAAG